jgi:hypothetical protein
MKKIVIVILIVFGIFACETGKPDLITDGKVKGLKKGKIYLQKWQDSTIVNLDSISLYNENTFGFELQIDHPEVMYLQLQKDTIDPTDNYITFFADKGKLSVDAVLNEFIYAEIEADYPNQNQFYDYNKTMKRFSEQKLDLIKAELVARKSNDNIRLDSVNKAYNKMNQRRSLYGINFALAHPQLEVSPYIILEQSKYISEAYLDTVYQKLDKKIKNSFYGKKLKNRLDTSIQ